MYVEKEVPVERYYEPCHQVVSHCHGGHVAHDHSHGHSFHGHHGHHGYHGHSHGHSHDRSATYLYEDELDKDIPVVTLKSSKRGEIFGSNPRSKSVIRSGWHGSHHDGGNSKVHRGGSVVRSSGFKTDEHTSGKKSSGEKVRWSDSKGVTDFTEVNCVPRLPINHDDHW